MSTNTINSELQSKINIRLDDLAAVANRSIWNFFNRMQSDTVVMDFAGVGKYTFGEQFDMLNGTLWRQDLKNNGWFNSGYDFVPWTGNVQCATEGKKFIMNFFKGKLQSIAYAS